VRSIARTQRIYYAFSCSPRYAMPIERISAHLNGSVIKREATTITRRTRTSAPG
jgi:hypothetical protein